ncbi:MAG: hypothetical protein HYT61_03510 [Candidatus Yanofskybacteria bacterium]|nr:hypothetical protein [Candidatus Yanofskybacteria bacterium]
MIIMLLMVLASIGIVLTAERHATTRGVIRGLAQAYTPGTCHSFLLDIPILLPLVGLLVEVLARRINSLRALAIFPTITSLIFLFAGFFLQNNFLMILAFILYCPFVPGLLFGGKTWLWWTMRQTPLYYTALVIFLTISGSLYVDYINFSFLTPLLGHAEAWSGNHFMWNSGIEVVGFNPLIDTTVPTYKNFLGSWNLLALVLFLTYPFVMIGAGTRIHGLIFGYSEKQTGISALFLERKT